VVVIDVQTPGPRRFDGAGRAQIRTGRASSRTLRLRELRRFAGLLEPAQVSDFFAHLLRREPVGSRMPLRWIAAAATTVAVASP
jgi:hypothetical protein